LDAPPTPPEARTRKKPSYPVGEELRNYLKRYRRERELPVTYERLRHFHESHPIMDAEGRNTLWESVAYTAEEIPGLNEDLKRIYALLRVDGDFSVMQHLYIDRIDFCSFGNSTPFRIKIVNAYNDNPDYFYIKKADASRVYGLELEHLLSPNRLNFLTAGTTLVEEHIAGIPGDIFIDRWLQRPELRPIRIAKELVKFNERSFVQLLGDMRSYNFVVVITPDFEGSQIRIRAMDFDQQAHNGRKTSTCRSSSRRTCRSSSSARSTCTSRPRSNTSARSRRSCSPAPSWPPRASTSCSPPWPATPSPRRRTSSCFAKAWPSTSRTTGISNARAWAPWSARISKPSAKTSRKASARSKQIKSSLELARQTEMHFNAKAQRREVREPHLGDFALISVLRHQFSVLCSLYYPTPSSVIRPLNEVLLAPP